jgi:hypothetical protein
MEVGSHARPALASGGGVVWPAGFIEWLNREVLGSSEDLAPLTPERAFVVNVRFGWG